MKGIALGQYYPARSPIHALDPRMKIILALIYIISSFLCRNTASFLLLFGSAILLILLSRVPLRIVFRSIKGIIFIMCFTAILNIFWTAGEPENLLFSWKFINIYTEGVYGAAFLIIRIIAMVIGSSIFLTYTTTPIELTDGIEQLLRPLAKLKLPVHEFAMMMSIALRFIPTILEEAEKIMAAQKSRGADFTTGSPIHRIKSLVPILIPLLISSFRHATDLATAMTCRCYRGGKGRTRMKVLRYRTVDLVFFVGMILLCVGFVACNAHAQIPYIGYSI